MKLTQKIKKFRANHKIAAAISDGAAVFAAGNAGAAMLDVLLDALIQPQISHTLQTSHIQLIQEANADFYDGCRGPNTFQLDQRIGFGENGATNYTLLPKVFVDDNKDGAGFFGVTPFNYTPNHKPNAGAGVGGFYSSGNVNVLGVVPVVYSGDGEAINVNPTVYTTLMLGEVLIDPRVSYLASIPSSSTSQTSQGKTTHHLSFGTTIGYTIDNVVVGVDAETGVDAENLQGRQLKNSLTYQGILRIDLDAQHKNWVETYVGKEAVGVGFRANFK